MKKIILANPRGFCAGVDRAIGMVEQAIEVLGAPIYVRHEVVHNKHVVDELKQKGAIFIDEVDQAPDDSTLIFSAHGVSRMVRKSARKRDLRVFDATCPLVTKVHLEVMRHAKAGREVILIGHAGHPEVEGTMGQYEHDNANGCIYLIQSLADVKKLKVNDPKQLAYVTQTTLSVNDTRDIIQALKNRFPALTGPKKNDICYATQNRQDAILSLSAVCDLILVVGSKNSSNSNRLKELAEQQGITAYLIDDENDIDPAWLTPANIIGITAGASAPERLVQRVITAMKKLGIEKIEQQTGQEEQIIFPLPKVLKKVITKG